MVREWNILAQNVGKSSVSILSLEWRRAVKHFVDQNAQRPPVNSARVPGTLNDLGSNVFFRANK